MDGCEVGDTYHHIETRIRDITLRFEVLLSFSADVKILGYIAATEDYFQLTLVFLRMHRQY